MLKGPVMLSSRAIAAVVLRIFAAVIPYIFWGGNCIVASPECTPANSMCSEIAEAITFPPSATASHSSSLQRCMNELITTGCSSDTSTAMSRNTLRSSKL